MKKKKFENEVAEITETKAGSNTYVLHFKKEWFEKEPPLVALRDLLAEFVDAKKGRDKKRLLVADFKDVVYFTSAGVGILGKAYKNLSAKHDGFILTAISQDIQELFENVKFDHRLFGDSYKPDESAQDVVDSAAKRRR